MALNLSKDEARKLLTHQVLSARLLPEIETARLALREWLQTYPEEKGMRAGFEQLAQMQEIAEMLDVDTAEPVRQVA